MRAITRMDALHTLHVPNHKSTLVIALFEEAFVRHVILQLHDHPSCPVVVWRAQWNEAQVEPFKYVRAASVGTHGDTNMQWPTIMRAVLLISLAWS